MEGAQCVIRNLFKSALLELDSLVEHDCLVLICLQLIQLNKHKLEDSYNRCINACNQHKKILNIDCSGFQYCILYLPLGLPQAAFYIDNKNVVRLSSCFSFNFLRSRVRAVLTLSIVRNIMAAISFVGILSFKKAASLKSAGDIEGQ